MLRLFSGWSQARARRNFRFNSRKARVEFLERRELLASYSTPEDTALVVSDPALATLRVVSPPLHGTVSPTNVGGFAYAPAPNYHGPDRFTYVLATTSNTATGELQEASITVTPVNDRPVANPDEFVTYRNRPLSIEAPGVLKNDKDIDSERLTAKIEKLPEQGTLTLNENGSFQYTPKEGYTGTDSFTYRASDGQLASEPARVAIAVKALPDARDDQYSVKQDGVLSIAPKGVLANDVPLSTFGLVASLEAGDANKPQHGTLELRADGSFTYKPNAGYTGPDSFLYRATDATPTLSPPAGSTASPLPPPFDVARVQLYVYPSPIIRANDDVYATIVGAPLTIEAPGVLKNDFVLYAAPTTGGNTAASGESNTVPGTAVTEPTQPINAPLTAVLLTSPPPAGLTFNANGSFRYQPPADFQGSVTFSYQATLATTTAAGDLAGTTASDPTTSDPAVRGDVATVTIHVRQLPDARDDSFRAWQNTVLTILPKGVLANDVPMKDRALKASLEPGEANAPKHGTVELRPDGSFTYKPRENYVGPDSFVYRATDVAPDAAAGSDILPASDLATVSIYVQATVPPIIAVDDFYRVETAAGLSVESPGVLKNDYSNWPTILPATTASSASTTPPTFAPVQLTAKLLTQPQNGALRFNPDGSFRYEPKAGFVGADTFTYRAQLANAADPNTSNALLAAGEGFTCQITASGLEICPPIPLDDIATVTIQVTKPEPPPGPIARNDFYTAAANTKLAIRAPGVLANDSPPWQPIPLDGTNGTGTNTPVTRPLAAVIVDQPAHGKVVLNANGSFEYQADKDYVGMDTFTYQASWQNPVTDATTNTAASDGLPILSSKATVTIRVVPALATADSYTTLQDTPLHIAAPGVLGNDAGGSETQPLKAVLVTEPLHGKLKLNADGSFSYEPTARFTGSDLFVYRADTSLGTIADPAAGEGDPNAPRPIVEQQGNVAIVRIFVRAAQSSVQAYPDRYLAIKDTTLTVAKPGVLANDYALVNHRVEASLAEGPAHGTVAVNADGGFTYTPAVGFTGEDRFTYRASDLDGTPSNAAGTVNVSYASVVIHVRGEETPAKFLPGDDLRTTDDGGVQRIADWATLLAVAKDGKPDFLVSTDKPQLFAVPPAIDATGQLTYAPAPNARGEATVTVMLKGDAGDANAPSASFTIRIDKPFLMHNVAKAEDVTGDLAVAPNDALEIIDFINAFRAQAVAEGESTSRYYDVNKDNFIAPSDALAVIDYLNSLSPTSPGSSSGGDSAEGEYAAAADLSLLAMMNDGLLDATGKRKRS